MARLGELTFDKQPLQVGLCRSPWHVAVSTLLIQRGVHAPRVHEALYCLCPNPLMMALSDTDELGALLSLHRSRVRQLQQLSHKWDARCWRDLRELPGISDYVADAVQLFCFNKESTC